MAFMSPEDRAFAEAVTRLGYCNPFLPERIEAEKAAAGSAFVPHGDVWSVKAGDDAEAPNVRTISARTEEVTTAVRERLRATGAKPTLRELSLYRDLVVYTLVVNAVRWSASTKELRQVNHYRRAGEYETREFHEAFERTHFGYIHKWLRERGLIRYAYMDEVVAGR